MSDVLLKLFAVPLVAAACAAKVVPPPAPPVEPVSSLDEPSAPTRAVNPIRPDAKRTLARGIVLCAMARRTPLEGGDSDSIPWAKWRREIAKLDFGHEPTDPELKLLRAPLGTLKEQEVKRASWGVEGAAVLAWSLSLYELPPPDEVGDTGSVCKALGYFGDGPSEVRLRPLPELLAYEDLAVHVHWRMRELARTGAALDWAKVAKSAAWRPSDLAGIPLVEGDLAIDGVPLIRASRQQRALVGSIALERHRAINWLLGDNPVYADVDTGT